MKRTLSFLLALAMLLSVIPMTALTTAAVTADEAAETGETYGVSSGEALFAMLEKDTLAGDVMTINVNADINYYVTTEGVSGDASYLRYACTLGQGKKILNLNGHKLHFYNDYSVIVDHYGAGSQYLSAHNRQCLFEIPTGADLIVNGKNSESVHATVQYHGKLLDKCDAIDQRDIFEIRGGNLTVNSGNFIAGGDLTSYTHGSTKTYYLVSGMAIRAISGNLTVNGGYFEGRGVYTYNLSRNCALYAAESMSSVVIYDGEFVGASHANVLDITGDEVIKGGLYKLDTTSGRVGTEYNNSYFSSLNYGVQGITINDPSPYTHYYTRADANDVGHYDDVPYDSIKANPNYLRNTKNQMVLIIPNDGKTAGQEETSELKFRCRGKQYSTQDDIRWHVGDPLDVYLEPESFYYEENDPYDDMNNGIFWHMNNTSVDLIEYISDGNQPVILEDQEIDIFKDSSGRYYFNLNGFSQYIKNKLYEGHTYCFKFSVEESWHTNNYRYVTHTGRFYVTISQSITQLSCEIDEPEYYKLPTANVYTDISTDICEINLVSWTYKTSESDSWHSMSDSDYFRRDRIYAANFIVNMKTGYTLVNNPVFYVNGEQANVSYSNTGGLIASAEFDMRAEPISSISIYDVPAPVDGDTPIYSYDYPGGYYYVDPMYMDWRDGYGFLMKKADTFEGGKDYTVYFHVTTDNGYSFADEIGAFINGNPARVTEKWTDSYGTGHARVEYTFTCPITYETINSLNVTVTEPEAGKELSYSASVPSGMGYEIESYSNGSSWKDGMKWVDEYGENLPIGTKAEAGESYTAWVSLEITDTDGYRFAPADMIMAYMNDNDAEVHEFDEFNYGVYYTFTVPEAGSSTEIESFDVTITAPEADGSPSYIASAPSGSGYIVEDYDMDGEWLDGVKWQDQSGFNIDPASDTTFTAGLRYTVTVSLILTDSATVSDKSLTNGTINGEPIDGFYWYGSNNVIIWHEFLIEDAPLSGTFGNMCTWTFDPDSGVLTISGKEYSHMPRTMSSDEIPWSAYKNDIRKAVIEDSVTGSLGTNAFKQCGNLTEAVIGNNITEIGWSAFEDCPKLTKVTFGEKVSTLGPECFCNTGFTSVTIPDTVTWIREYAFCNCEKLESVDLGSGVGRVGECAFLNCPMTEITIPDSVKQIDNKAFGFVGTDTIDGFKITANDNAAAKAYAERNGFTYVDTAAPQTKTLLGDVDGDGEVSILDATAIQRRLAGLSTEYVEAAADLDEDGEVSILDATEIQRFLAGLSTKGQRIGQYI